MRRPHYPKRNAGIIAKQWRGIPWHACQEGNYQRIDMMVTRRPPPYLLGDLEVPEAISS